MPLSDTTLHSSRARAEARPETPPAGPLRAALLRAARADEGRGALRIRMTGGPDSAPRLLRHLLDEAARGGPVFNFDAGDFLLPEADAATLKRTAAAIETLFATRAAGFELTTWTMPRDAGALLALAETEAEAPLPPAPDSPSPTGLDTATDRIALSDILQRRPVLRLGVPGSVALGLLRLGIGSHGLATALGAQGGDPDLLRHARDRMSRRLLAALAEDAARLDLLGPEGSRRLLVEVAPGALPTVEDTPAEAPDRPVEPAMLAALPLAVAGDPALLARQRAALAAHGWGLALRGLTAAALGLIAPEALEADLLLLRWSPAMAERAASAALRRVDPARLVLIGCEDEAALQWGLSQGIRLFGGGHPELVLTARRMATCPDRAGCTRRQCLLRAAATAPAGRVGCTNPVLLAGFLPAAMDTTMQDAS